VYPGLLAFFAFLFAHDSSEELFLKFMGETCWTYFSRTLLLVYILFISSGIGGHVEWIVFLPVNGIHSFLSAMSISSCKLMFRNVYCWWWVGHHSVLKQKPGTGGRQIINQFNLKLTFTGLGLKVSYFLHTACKEEQRS